MAWKWERGFLLTCNGKKEIGMQEHGAQDGKNDRFEVGFKRFEFGCNGHMTVGGAGLPKAANATILDPLSSAENSGCLEALT